MKKVLLFVFVFLLLPVIHSYSQIGITAYRYSKIGINTNQNNRIFGEFRILTNNQIDETEEFDFSILYNIRRQDRSIIYLGLGLSICPFREYDNINGIQVPIGFQIFPLKDIGNLSLLTEIAPSTDGESVSIKQLWGLRYNF